jgi:hypothetical protein
MKNWVFALIAVLTAVALAWLLWLVTPQEDYRVYDCSLAEFHPDYPREVREECRKIRQQSTKNYI